MNSPEPRRIRSAFAIGGPAFNLVLVAILVTITFLAVALPDRTVEAAGVGIVDAKERGRVSVPRIVPATSTTTTEPPPVEIELPPPPPEPEGVVRITTPVVQVTTDPTPPAPTPTIPARPECRDFAQQPEAQVAFDADPATLGYFDLKQNQKSQDYGGIRPGCWINVIPAGGLVFAPDASAGCKCSYQNQAWIALQPADIRPPLIKPPGQTAPKPFQ